jgi:hypothetical protein
MELTTSPVCASCQLEKETALHFVCVCLTLATLKTRIFWQAHNECVGISRGLGIRNTDKPLTQLSSVHVEFLINDPCFYQFSQLWSLFCSIYFCVFIFIHFVIKFPYSCLFIYTSSKLTFPNFS